MARLSAQQLQNNRSLLAQARAKLQGAEPDIIGAHASVQQVLDAIATAGTKENYQRYCEARAELRRVMAMIRGRSAPKTEG